MATLLELDGSIIDQGSGYWTKIEAWRVAASVEVPHGIRYSLTLHEPYGKRILGFDNAHAVKLPGRFKQGGQRLRFDHKHQSSSDPGVPYQFENAYQLLEDFFKEVGRIMSKELY